MTVRLSEKGCGKDLLLTQDLVFLSFLIYLAAPGLSCSMWDLIP